MFQPSWSSLTIRALVTGFVGLLAMSAPLIGADHSPETLIAVKTPNGAVIQAELADTALKQPRGSCSVSSLQMTEACSLSLGTPNLGYSG